MEVDRPDISTCLTCLMSCFVLSLAYVASLYIWNNEESRDHPAIIKKRFSSVFAVMCLSPPFVYMCLNDSVLRKASIWQLLGLKIEGLIPATVLPLFLTMVLFLGPLSMQGLTGLWRLYTDPVFWVWNLRDLKFLRSHVVAPVAEEFVFRACMLPLLLQYFRPMTAIFIAPLFFGVAHLHHIADRMRHELLPFKQAFIISCFQMTYTTIFGAYSAFLFVRTGHLVAPCIAHSFCNHMGFPDFAEVLSYKKTQRLIVASLFILGLVSWCLMLTPLTNPKLYKSNLFWKNQM